MKSYQRSFNLSVLLIQLFLFYYLFIVKNVSTPGWECIQLALIKNELGEKEWVGEGGMGKRRRGYHSNVVLAYLLI